MDGYINEVRAFLKRTEDGTPFFVFDTETTGLSADKDDIIQFSAVKAKANGDGTYTILEKFDTYINPGYHIPDEASKVNGITDETVKDAPDKNVAARRIEEFLGSSPVLVGYNSISFDEKFMVSLYAMTMGKPFVYDMHLDVFKMAKEKLPAPRKLIDVAQRYGFDEKYTFHSSIEDAMATLDALREITPLYFSRSSEPLKKVAVIGHGHWERGDMNRLYINTTERNLKVFYDIKNNSWEISDPAYDLKNIVENVHAELGANDDTFSSKAVAAGWW